MCVYTEYILVNILILALNMDGHQKQIDGDLNFLPTKISTWQYSFTLGLNQIC